jgi:NADH-quinone oxidoreductase subunit E
MVQINADYYEDLSAQRFTAILDDLADGKPVKPGPQIERHFSAPVGGPTTLTEIPSYKMGVSGPGRQPALTDEEAKRPGAAANVTDSPIPKPPIADSTDTRRQ